MIPKMKSGFAEQSGRTIDVPSGANLQEFLNAARPGDTLVLQANATYVGNFRLPNISGESYVTITSSELSALPRSGMRVSPADSVHMPKLVAPAGTGRVMSQPPWPPASDPKRAKEARNWFAPVIETLPGAHHFKFVGVEISPSPGQDIWNTVLLGAYETQMSDVPHDFVFDRCYIHGAADQEARAGLVFNGSNMTAENNYICGFKSRWWDTVAIGGWAGPGPFRIVNNYLEAAGQNLFFGGAAPSIQGVIPSDFEIRGNHLFKPLFWRQEDPSFAGTAWIVKNLLEFKCGRRILIEGNILENCWARAQRGVAVLFTLRVEDGQASWNTLEDITFRNNIIRHAAGAFNLLGTDDFHNFEGYSNRLTVENNLFYDMDHRRWGELYPWSYSPTALILHAYHGISIKHNTAPDVTAVVAFHGHASNGFVMKDNIVNGSHNGIIADGMNDAQTVFDAYAPDAVFTSNAVIGGNPNSYTSGNHFPADINAVGFVDPSSNNYELRSESPYATAASDGTALGADVAAVEVATADVITGGSPSPEPPPSQSVPILINSGGEHYTDSSGQIWQADTNYYDGLVWVINDPISNTPDPTLYQTCRCGNFSYRCEVPDGTHRVTLKFAEPGHTVAGARVFDVAINGKTVLKGFDIFAEAGGLRIALDKSFTAEAANGLVTITFSGPAYDPMVNAIEISPAGDS